MIIIGIRIDIDEKIIASDFWPTNRRYKTFSKLEAYFFLMLHLELEDGLYSTQILKLSKEWGWSRTKVRDYINQLKQDNIIQFAKDKDKFLIIERYNGTEKDNVKDTKKYTEKYTKKDIKKDTLESGEITTFKESSDIKKDTEENTKINTEKDIEKNTLIDGEKYRVEEMDMEDILSIIKM